MITRLSHNGAHGGVFFSQGEMLGFQVPARVMGIAHWQNISPVGDVWLMFAFIAGDLFLAHKAFGTFLLPTEF